MTRIALISDWFLPRLGGIETHLAGLATALRQAGQDPVVLTTIPGPREVDGVKIERLACRLDPIFHLAVSPALLGHMTEHLKAGRFDVAHVHVSFIAPVALAGILAAKRLGLPCVITFHSVLMRSIPLIRSADQLFGWSDGHVVLTAVSQLVASQVARAFPRHSIGVLPNGVERSFWQDGYAPPQPRSEITLVSTMRLNWKKRPQQLIAAFDKARLAVAAKGRRLRLKIAGDGAERRSMERQLQTLGCGDDVELLGARSHPELRALYQAADLFVLASEQEAFGIAPLEARCAGLPVICMAKSGATEFLSHGTTGLLAQSDDDLVSDIVRLALNDRLRADLAVPDEGLARFDWSRVANHHLSTYERAIAGRSVQMISASV